MDKEILVASQIVDGKRLVDQLVRDGVEVTVAFWVKVGEDSLWTLYIASPLVDEERPGPYYQNVFNIMEKLPDSSVLLTDFQLLNDKNPIAQEAIAIRDRYPSKEPTKVQDKRLGDLMIKEALIYPPREFLRQMFSVEYSQKAGSGIWKAQTKRCGIYKGIPLKGAVSYSAPLPWENESEGSEAFAKVSVLVELDPRFDPEDLLDHPEIDRMLVDQARAMADEMFKARHPKAVIEHCDAVVDV